MKKYLICALLSTLFVYFVRGSIDEERRFREGNSFSRKMRSCGLFCSLKGNKGSYNQTRCYRISSQNEWVVVTDCVFKCLRSKGEFPVAEECECRNGVCIEKQPTATDNTDNNVTDAPTATPESESNTESATNPTNSQKNNRRKGNQGMKGAKDQNSKNSNKSKQ